jgi:hypothetical protein
LLGRFQSLYPAKILIDSSKELKGIKLFYLDKARAGEIDLQVIFLVRDVRSWAVIAERGWLSFLIETYRWMKATLNLRRFLRSARVSAYCLSFESFVFDPETEIEKLARWLRVENSFSASRLDLSAMHELFGNAGLRTDSARGERLVYNSAWLTEWGPTLLGPLILPPLLVNRSILRSLAGKPMTADRAQSDASMTKSVEETHQTTGAVRGR